MRIPNMVRAAGDWALLPTIVTGLTIGAAYGALQLELSFKFSEKVLEFIREESDRKTIVAAVGFCGTLAGCVALIKTLPFTQFTSWGRPHFKWDVIEAYFNKV